jgi:hypothetical protein
MADQLRRDPGAREGGDEKQDDEDAARERGAVPTEPPPDLLPVAPCPDLELAELGARLRCDGSTKARVGRENLSRLLDGGQLRPPLVVPGDGLAF